MKTKKVETNIDHKALRDDLLKLLDKYAGKMDAVQTLAIASHTVGQLLAMQDQRLAAPEFFMQLVQDNIEQGNADAVSALVGRPLGSA